ncbi:MAG: type VI secretion system baseplate subunit TssG [Fibrobacteria bacterium]|nr:type VI secretion system baseplate subunit TssG [Fibrobacteria bacterium]
MSPTDSGSWKGASREFEFAQWIRLWLRECQVEGRSAHDLLTLLEESLRLAHSGSLGFAPQDIAEFRPSSEGGKAALSLHFLGLKGASSPLPGYLTDLLQSAHPGAPGLRAFLEIFENRLYQLQAIALLSRRPGVREELRSADRLSARLRSLAGVDEEGQASRRMGGMGLLAPKRKSARSLEILLARQLSLSPVKIQDRCVSLIASPKPPALGDMKLDGRQPLAGAMRCGGELLKIRMGPVPWAKFSEITRDTEAFRIRMRSIVDEFLPRPMGWIAEVVLDVSTVPGDVGIRLGDGPAPVRIGQGAWIGEGKTSTLLTVVSENPPPPREFHEAEG